MPCSSTGTTLLVFLCIALLFFGGGILVDRNFLIEEKPTSVEIAKVDTAQIISEARFGYLPKDSVDKLIANLKPQIEWREITWEKSDEPEADTSKHIYKIEIEVENEGDVPIAEMDSVIKFESEGKDDSGIPYTFSARLKHKCKYIYPPGHIFKNDYDLFDVKATFLYDEPKPLPWWLDWSTSDIGRALILSAGIYAGYKIGDKLLNK